MKKNLKKVISAVLALTLAMSSFVAMTTSAATFADVADTANYAEAVNALAALGAISGYEDGTFLPDNNITRAEVTTMVVAALNMTADAQASGATTKFADVNEKAKWAAGYVNVGVANGWISGMSATEFAPSDNVTYAQVLSMLTRILGYGDYAITKGGWPDGYLAAAASAGILSGVSAAANDAMTRAQVARLIWNAVQAPMLEVTVFGVDANNSSMQKLDGGKDGSGTFKTILSDKFEAYVFPNVQVTEISDTAEVKLELLAKAAWNPSSSTGLASAGQQLSKVKVGKTTADSELFASAKVVATYIDEEWELVYFKPTSRVATTTVDGSLFAEFNPVVNPGDPDAEATELKIRKSKTTNAVNKYDLNNGLTDGADTDADNTEVYVNGVKVLDKIKTATEHANAKALLQAAAGDVVLYEKAGASGKVYDKIMINMYGITEVAQITEKNDSVKVSFASISYPAGLASSGGSFTVTDDDVAAGKKLVTVTKNGEAADLSALAEGDIIAVKYDMTGSIDSASKVEIIATTDKVTGVFNYYDTEEDLYDIGGAMYEASAAGSIGSPVLGTTYTFALDPFGKLYTAQEEATAKSYAIVERYVDASVNGGAEFDYLDVVTLEGQSKRLYVDDKAKDDIAAKVAQILGLSDLNSNGILDELAAALTNGKYDFTTSNRIDGRVISYNVRTSTGRVNKVDVAAVEFIGGSYAATAQYNAAANRLSKALADSVVVLDASKYAALSNTDRSADDYKASSLSSLSEDVLYEGFLVHQNNNKRYSYVVLTKAGTFYGPASDFAVAAANPSRYDKDEIDDEEVYTLRVIKDGATEAEKINIATNAVVYYGAGSVRYDAFTSADLVKGSVFFYTVDADGFVDRIDVVYKGQTTLDGYRANDTVVAPASADAVSAGINGWTVNFATPAGTGEQVELFAAPVVLVNGSSISFAKNGVEGSAGAYYVDTEVLADYTVASDANIYYQDVSGDITNYAAFSKGVFTGINLQKASVNPANSGYAWLQDASWMDGSNTVVETNFDGIIKSAMVMAVDGIITNAIIFGK